MKKILKFLLLTIAFLFLFGIDGNKVSAEEISITTENFPEEWLRNLLTTSQFDKNSDGILSEEELKDIKKINCVFEEKKEIVGADGIGRLPYLENIFFKNVKCDNLKLIHCPAKLKEIGICDSEIRKLKISSNSIVKIWLPTVDPLEAGSPSCMIENIDVSGCKKLETLFCEEAGVLSKVNVRGCSNLAVLRCSFNKLKKLDVSQNKKLELLWCEDNKLETIDISQNKKLIEFLCSGNQLKTLNLSQNKKLTYLYCSRNKLKKLDLYHNRELVEIRCMKNRLTSLDLTQNKKLRWVTFRNNKIKKLKLPNSGFLHGARVEGDDPEVESAIYSNFVRNPIRVVDITEVKRLKKFSRKDALKFLSGGFCQIELLYPPEYYPDKYHLDVKERPIKKLVVSKKMNTKDKKWIQKKAKKYKVKVVYK